MTRILTKTLTLLFCFSCYNLEAADGPYGSYGPEEDDDGIPALCRPSTPIGQPTTPTEQPTTPTGQPTRFRDAPPPLSRASSRGPEENSDGEDWGTRGAFSSGVEPLQFGSNPEEVFFPRQIFGFNLNELDPFNSGDETSYFRRGGIQNLFTQPLVRGWTSSAPSYDDSYKLITKIVAPDGRIIFLQIARLPEFLFSQQTSYFSWDFGRYGASGGQWGYY